MNDRLDTLLSFFFEINRLKLVDRQSYVTSTTRRESVPEHCWHLSLLALCLVRDMEGSLDVGRTLQLIAIHDLPELYAGDTFAYDKIGKVNQERRENEAAQRLWGQTPADIAKDLTELWNEFQEQKTPEARFAKALDRFQGFLQQFIAQGRTWQEAGITKDMTRQRTDFPRAFASVFEEIIDHLYSLGDSQELWPNERK